jgi:hypothetical protein
VSDEAALWNLRTGAYQSLGSGLGLAVNANGWAVTSDAGLVRDGKPVPLPPIKPAGTTNRVVAVSDTDIVVGDSISPTEHTMPTIWQC